MMDVLCWAGGRSACCELQLAAAFPTRQRQEAAARLSRSRSIKGLFPFAPVCLSCSDKRARHVASFKLRLVQNRMLTSTL